MIGPSAPQSSTRLISRRTFFLRVSATVADGGSWVGIRTSHMMPPALPVELWLLIFEYLPEHDELWSVVRNVSRYLRIYIDEYFRYAILPNTLVALQYSTIHSSSVLPFTHLKVPMQFNRLSLDGTRAVYGQVRYKQASDNNGGSVRGWVPFIERYYREVGKPQPKVLHKSKSTPGRPLWERDHRQRMKIPAKYRATYLADIRHYTSLGRGDRPPHYIRIGDYTKDTELVDLELDCTAHELSFDWRRTFSAFFVEQHFVICAIRKDGTPCNPYIDTHTPKTQRPNMSHGTCCAVHYIHVRVARRKRLQPWLAANKTRVSDANLQIAESNYQTFRQDILNNRKDCVAIGPGDVDSEEMVPENCAGDYPELLVNIRHKPPTGSRGYFSCILI